MCVSKDRLKCKQFGGAKNAALHWWDQPLLKKTSQDEQQIQSTKTTNINYIQNFISIKENLQKLKKASDKI